MNTSGVVANVRSLSGQWVELGSIIGFVFEVTEGMSRLAIALIVGFWGIAWRAERICEP